MPASQAVWGIDIGQCALKALKLHQSDDSLQVEQFEVIEHESVLSQPDVDVPALIRASLEEFLRRQDISDSTVCVSVLGKSSFTRFVKLPPVEAKRIPEIVRFEAEQQIPFPIDEVTWRYQTFQDADSPEVEAGIFAMKQVDIAEMLSYFQMAELDVDVVQMAPLALYNMMDFDGLCASEGATLLADVGADKTHLVVADGGRVWTRTVQIGGNNFTEALVKSFKLNFAKAEKLKRTAAQSKYARQIFQVMRPVFADLVQEIQRSIGYYTSLNRDTRFKRLVGMGNGFRLPGMQKYLEQNLNMPVARAKGFKKVSSSFEGFGENALSFGVAYGLAIQGLDLATVHTNLLPEAILKQRLWGRKKPWFAASAAALVIAAGSYVFSNMGDRSALQSPDALKQQANARTIVKRLEDWRQQATKYAGDLTKEKDAIRASLKYRAYASVWPELNSRIDTAVNQRMLGETERQIVESFAKAGANQAQLAGQVVGDQARLELVSMLPYEKSTEEGKLTLRETLLSQIAKRPRNQRRLVILESQRSTYLPDLAKAPKAGQAGRTAPTPGMDPGMDEYGPGRRTPSQSNRRSESESADTTRGFEIILGGRTPLSQAQAVQLVGELKKALKESLDASKQLSVFGEIDTAYPGSETKTPTGGGLRGLGAPRETGFGGTLGSPSGTAAAPVGPKNPDPLFPAESMDGDVRFELTVRVAVTGDGLTSADQADTTTASPRR